MAAGVMLDADDAGEHLLPIGGGWSVWRRICVRSAGFPIETLEALGSPPAARAVEQRGADAASERAAQEIFAAEMSRIGRCVRDIARHPRFVEALTWQNRPALERGVAHLLRQPDGAQNRDARRGELLVASYIQRYCAKNDMIGFFGPVAWATLDDRGPSELRTGRDLVARRETYFEHWAVDELARALAADPAVRPMLAPRRHPSVRVDGNALYDGRLRRIELPPAFARLLAACDGIRSARTIAAELTADVSLDLDGEEEVYELLYQLVAKNLASWTLEVPTLPPRPERALEAELRRLGAAPALAAVAELDAARQAVAAAAGRPAELGGALAALDEVFERLTGRSPERRAGAVYAGRRLVYEDCTRDINLRLGPLFVERLARPLELVLRSARWFSSTIASRYLAAARDIHRALRAEIGKPEVELLRLWERAAPLFPNGSAASPIVRDVRDELQRRWRELLALDPSRRREERSAAALLAPVSGAFDAPGPGWPWARHHSPDVLIAAAGPEAIQRGDFYLVLGEVHAAVQTYVLPAYFALADDAAAQLRAHQVDIATPCLFPVTSRRQATRVDFGSLSSRDLDLELGDTRSHRARDQVLAVADLVAVEVDDRLVVRTRDHRHTFDALAFFNYYLSAESVAHFRLLPDEPHTPRVTIDHMVIARERWVFAPADLRFCHAEAGRYDRFAAARTWSAEYGLPRLVFVKIPEEAKPIYIDLESPLFVEHFAYLVRKASSVAISEMLPGPDESWLVDADGHHYTSELRIAAVDPRRWGPI